MKKVALSAKNLHVKKVSIEEVLRNIHYRDLEIFESVARFSSIAAAARELRLQPPHISKALKRLESATDANLFTRSTSGMTLTTDGNHFLGFVKDLSELISSTEWNSSTDLASSKKSLITASGASFLMAHVLGPVISKSQSLNSAYRYRLLELGDDQLVSGSIKNSFELAIHTKKLDFPKSWLSSPIGNLPWALCSRSGHPLGSVANETDVKKYPFITPVNLNGNAYRHGDDHCPLKSKNRIVGDEAQTAEVGLSLVASSDQLIFVPEILVQDRIEQGKFQKIEVRQWYPVIETLYLSAQADIIKQSLFDQILRQCEKLIQ